MSLQAIKYKKFHRLIRMYAKAIFNHFDKELDPQVQLLSINMTEGVLKVDIMPDYHGLSRILKTLNGKFGEVGDGLYRAIEDITSSYDQKNNEYAILSDFEMVDDQLMAVRIAVDSRIYDQYYRLEKRNEGGIFSLLDSVSNEVKLDLAKALYQLSKDDDITSINFNDTIRRSGRKLLRILGYPGIWDNTFDKLNKISSLYYEKESVSGRILFTKTHRLIDTEDSDYIEKLTMLKTKVPLTNARHVRKLLEISKDDVHLLSDSEYIYGIGRLKPSNYMELEEFFFVEFTANYTWHLSHGRHKLMMISHEQVSLPKARVSYYDFLKHITSLYPTIDKSNINNLYRIILEASNQSKGTMIVISKNAMSEANRLKSQCFLIKPTFLQADTVRYIASIDGAILVDLESTCYGIGAILDGLATTKGDSSRGARFNSAIRYVETLYNNEEYSDPLAIVVSEDGYIDMVSKFTI